MRMITATEANRDFSKLLEEVSDGETVAITKHGKVVASLVPAARTLEEMPLLTAQPGWSTLAAVRNGRVAIGDGNLYFNRPSPSLAETTEIIAEILHPGEVDFGHRGRGWVQFGNTSH